MKLGYKNWLIIKEMSGVTADIGDVELKKYSSGYQTLFDVDGVKYTVELFGPSRWPDVTKALYSIVLISSETTLDPALKTKNPMAVYSGVAKAIRKLMDTTNVEALRFSAHAPVTEPIYDLIYKRYLSKAFTRVGSIYYLRNDLYNKYKQENGTAWTDIDRDDQYGQVDLTNKISKGNAQRVAQRKPGITP